MQPTRAVLVSLLVVFVLLSALLAKCLQTSRLGVVILSVRQVYSRKNWTLLLQLVWEISEEVLLLM